MRHGSLFSGIGGFDLAAQWMGWENIFHCEKEKFCQKVLRYWFPDSILYENIITTDFTIHRGTIDILTGGFPCQPYSQAGKRKGKEDERHLWPQMCRAIREIKPRWVVGENVYGLVNWSGGLVFEEVQADLENEGYEVQAYILPASAKNAPHQRLRCWFIAYSNSRGGCGEEGVREHDLRRSQSEKQDDNIKQTDKGLEQGTTPDTNGNGFKRSNGKHEINASEGRFDALGNIEQGNGNGDASDTCFWRMERYRGSSEIPKLQTAKFDSYNSKRQPRMDWHNFPTQSPICGRDDGLPGKLDGITFPKWRNESIKAYGNAIVPQIVFEIFKAIEIYETQK